MKKSAIAVSMVMALASTTASAAAMTTASFDMATPGGTFFAPDTAVTGSIGGGTWSVASPAPFFGVNWTAHSGTTFGPGTYSFDTLNGGTPGPSYTGIVVGAGQVGGHILFNWGSSLDIDVVNVWDVTWDAVNNVFVYTSTDVTVASPAAESLDGIFGLSMIDGPFGGYNANFNFTSPTTTVPPVANPDSSAIVPGSTTPITINVLSNDSDLKDGAPPAGDTVNLLSTTSSQGVSLTNNGDGTVTYAPSLGLTSGIIDTFQYTITNTQTVTSNAATVTITVSNNAAPVANNVQFTTDEDVVKVIGIQDTGDLGVIVATDADTGQTLTFSTVVSPTAQGGGVQINSGSGSITYTPKPNFNGTDTFNFFANDGIQDSSVGQITVQVTPINDAPVCSDVNLNTLPDTPLSIDVATKLISAACSDVDGDSMTFGLATLASTSGGTLTDDGLGTLTYNPAAGFEGDDSFTYTVSDGTLSSVPATANIKVSQPFGNFTMLDAQGNVFGGTNDVIFFWDGVSFNTDEADTNFGLLEIKSAKPHPFLGFVWTAHNIRIYKGPANPTDPAITYSFDTTCTTADLLAGKGSITNPCNGSFSPGQTVQFINMTVGYGQIGVHILFDWNTTSNIDVVNVYDVNAAWNQLGKTGSANRLWDGAAGSAPDPATVWALVSTDVNGDGFNGSPMIDGPFQDFYANFNSIVNLPPGTNVGNAVTDVKTISVSASDTNLGGGALPSVGAVGIWSLVLGMFSLITIRRYSK